MVCIEIYTKKNCPYCDKAKALLIKKSLYFKEILVDDNKFSNGLREEMQNRSGGRKTVPQIFINGKYIGGSDDLLILDSEGKLDLL